MKKLLLFFCTFLISISQSYSQDILLLKTSGKVVVGDTSEISTPGNYNLYVQNGILTEKVKVALRDASEWSDDSFDKTPSLQVVKQHIKENNHLVNMPSAKELVSNGYELKEMDSKLLEQIEWLWQHSISLQEQNKLLKQEIELLKQEIIKQK